MKKKWIIGLCLLLLVVMLPFSGTVAEAQTLTLGQLKEKYPHGAYWNHTKDGNEDYTWNPCTHHGSCAYSGSCGCNSYQGKAIQCMGFAYQLASLAYGCDARGWTSDASVSALSALKPGDIVRYKNNSHSIFVTAVEGDTVTYADCNSDSHCIIKWGQITTKQTLKASFTYVKAAPYALAAEPTLTVRYHAGGGVIDNAVVGYTYRVLSTNGINMRKDAGTGQTKVSALPHNTTFSVAVGDTKEADGYTWGKTTYNDKTGWVVISDFVEKIGEEWDGEYRVSEDMVCYSGGAVLSQNFVLGVALECVDDGNQWGLTKEGYRFDGWYTAEDGGGRRWEEGMLPEELYPDGETVTLYAVWIPIVAGDADGNGVLNNRDLALLQQCLNQWEVTVSAQADIDENGELNNRDLALLQQTLNGWFEEETIG